MYMYRVSFRGGWGGAFAPPWDLTSIYKKTAKDITTMLTKGKNYIHVHVVMNMTNRAQNAPECTSENQNFPGPL